jgi:hypothetical protein
MRFSYKRALETLTEYAYSQGYEKVVLNHKGVSFMNWRPRTLNEPISIYIEGKYTLEEKTYIFLHELGHHSLRKDWEEFEKRLPVIAYAEHVHLVYNDKRYKRRDSYIVSSLEEEFMAWDEGLKLAAELGIKIKMQNWIDLKSKCLKSYINYYATLKK